jgi:(R,R)-butanediol dehydrogenase/meso-butanediol dehydrogenase/diacetyl reductase
MRAARLFGPGDLRVVDVPPPLPPGADEVLIRISHCGVCGTDAHEWQHGGPMTPLERRHPSSGHVGPTTIGHEFTGTVEATGPEVDHLSVGQRVVAGAGQSCGECRNCRRGRTNLCDHYFTYGLSLDGGMAEQVVVPAAMCVAVPDSCPSERAALAQPLAIAMHAVSRADLTGVRRVLVVGAGGIGALLVAALTDRPLEVVVADLSTARLDAARELGAHETVLTSAGEPTDGIAADVAFETSGSEAGLRLALASVGRGGQVVVLGLPDDRIVLDTRRAVVDEVDLITSSAHVCANDLPAAVELLSRRNIDRTIIADVISMEALVERGLAPLAAGRAGGKVVVAVGPARPGRADVSTVTGVMNETDTSRRSLA